MAVQKIHFPFNVVFLFCSLRCRRWVVNCRRQDLLKKDCTYLNSNCKLCSIHFEHEMFLNFLKNRLKSSAIPTLFDIPNPPKMFASKRKPPSLRQSMCPDLQEGFEGNNILIYTVFVGETKSEAFPSLLP